jgi:hypothetical protein
MANWLWSIPPHNYQRCIDVGVFAVRSAGVGAARTVKEGDRIFAYLPGVSGIAGVFRAEGSYFQDVSILWPDGIFPHRVKVAAVALLPEASRIHLDAFKTKLEVGRGYPNFGLVIQKVVHPLSDHDARLLLELVKQRLGSGGPIPPLGPSLEPPASELERLRKELHGKQQRIGLLQRKVKDLETLLALAGPNLEDYLRLAHSSHGAAFEEATRQCFIALGFTLDPEFQGQPGEIDFAATAPYYVFGECQASAGDNIGVAVVDKLTRHVRRYLKARSLSPTTEGCPVVVSELATAQLAQDAATEGVAILRPSQLAALLKLKREFPGAVHPYNIRTVLVTGGDISASVARFIDVTREEIEKRVGIIEVLKNDRFKPQAGGGSRDPGWIQARVEIELESHIAMAEIEDILLELTSPLVGCVGVEKGSDGRERYFYIRDYDFQIASVGPREEAFRD